MKSSSILLLMAATAWAQEANSGFELRTTLSAATSYTQELSEPPRDGVQVAPGFRAMLYPTWKLSSHWILSGAFQAHSRPYFGEEFKTQGYGAKGDLLQLNLSYVRFWGDNRSIVARVGQMSSAFGAFLQRYDPADNPLIGIPSAYGYYYKPVTFQGLAGAQVDVTVGKLDARAQFVNSSPANRRSVFDRDQYGNWAGGAGYTIRQGFRVGGSAYTGPYLDRKYPYYFPGEARPRDLQGRGYGLDVQWGWRHLNLWGELQRFTMEYRAIPTFTQHMGYTEARLVLNPRWYAASRVGYVRGPYSGTQSYELGAGFRLSASRLVKFGYTIRQGAEYKGSSGNVAAIEFVTSFRAISFATR